MLRHLMALLYIAAGFNHFRKPEFYLGIMLPYLPAPQLLNDAAGVLEIVLGAALWWRRTRPAAAWGLAVLLVLFLSVHVHMLRQAQRFPHYTLSVGVAWLRLLFQPVLVAWALWYRR